MVAFGEPGEEINEAVHHHEVVHRNLAEDSVHREQIGEIDDGVGDHKLRAAEIFVTMLSSWLAIESFLDGTA